MESPTSDISSKLQRSDAQTDTLVSQLEATEEIVVPVVKEEIEIRKEIQKTGTLRIRKTVQETAEVAQATLLSETASVQRVPVDRLVDAMPPIRTEGEITIVPVVREEIVVTKRLRVVEELHISKQTATTVHQEPVMLLAENVVIERITEEDREEAQRLHQAQD